ncbi:MAG: hypothetical protein QOG96_3640, partial [Pseudonocardiales bacterium]|nr:hypothetical protein [Pseudonocardiales bacterium]
VTEQPGDPYWGPDREHRGRIGQITAPTLLFGGDPKTGGRTDNAGRASRRHHRGRAGHRA